jgi:hypothetical protein
MTRSQSRRVDPDFAERRAARSAVLFECFDDDHAATAVRVGETLVRWPNRYMDERGPETWARIMGLLDEIDAAEMGAAAE